LSSPLGLEKKTVNYETYPYHSQQRTGPPTEEKNNKQKHMMSEVVVLWGENDSDNFKPELILPSLIMPKIKLPFESFSFQGHNRPGKKLFVSSSFPE
jgi:hypothetical protein